MKLKHPNIVRTFQVGAAGELHFLVMEFLEGEPLDLVMAQRKIFPPAEAVRLAYQALQGLQHIHAQGLVHRDLKPANLMLVPAPEPPARSTAHCTLKILDIGLGRALFNDEAEESSLDPSLTGEGVLLGTPDYMAPEQARDARAIDIRADIYGLGCVLYHLLAGQPPFPDSNIISQMIRHATETPTPLAKFNPAVPDGLQQIVNRMMAKDPAGRYPTPERAAQALQVYLTAASEALAAPENDPKMRSYLTWLEVEDSKLPAPAARKVGEGGPPPTASEMPTVRAAFSPAAPAGVPEGDRKPSSKVPAVSASPKALAGAGDKVRKTSSRSEAAKEKRRLKKMKRKAASKAPAVGAANAGPPVPTIDVELMPASVGPAPPVPFSIKQLTRRDFALFGVGAFAGAAATFLGCLVALARRPHQRTTPSDATPPAQP
jgi:serine/threonine protein kinase